MTFWQYLLPPVTPCREISLLTGVLMCDNVFTINRLPYCL
jgi:hypothetical protein